jgi:hypothetical protein
MIQSFFPAPASPSDQNRIHTYDHQSPELCKLMLNCSAKPNSCFHAQFVILKNMLDMFAESTLGLTEQLAKLFQSQLKTFYLQHDINLGTAILAAVNQELIGFIFHRVELQHL